MQEFLHLARIEQLPEVLARGGREPLISAALVAIFLTLS
jgi:hypothetical protein